MAERPTPSVSTRKEPRQARSTGLVADILQAAARVLAEEGAARFTTARVAERAGVSVGSLYQYFPNKAAILFRLQADEWRATTSLMADILGDGARTPPERLRALAHAFLRSECEEAALREALADAAPLYRDAPQARAVRVQGERAVAAFMDEALPGADAQRRALVGDLLVTTLSAAGKRVSSPVRAPDAVAAYAEALADLLVAGLERAAR